MNGDSGSTFDRARRRGLYRRLARTVTGRADPPDLLPLDEATKRLRPFQRRYVGIRPVPVRQIVGTDSRVRDFDRDFLPRNPVLGERWRRVEQAYPEGGFPPILVYQLGDAYFVLDGHHRVAIARQRGAETIDAEVTLLTARWHLDADADVVELIHAEQERIFMEDSGLAAAQPTLRIRVSRPVHYLELLENVQITATTRCERRARCFRRRRSRTTGTSGSTSRRSRRFAARASPTRPPGRPTPTTSSGRTTAGASSCPSAAASR